MSDAARTLTRIESRELVAGLSAMWELLLAIISGLVSGWIGGRASANRVFKKARLSASTKGDHSPNVQTAGDNNVTALRDVVMAQASEPPRAQLVIKTIGNRLLLENVGNAAAHEIEWTSASEHVIEGVRGFRIEYLEAGAVIDIGLVERSFGNARLPGHVVASWTDKPGGACQETRHTI